MGQRQNIASGTPWEEKVGYSRAVRVGNYVVVAGTTAADESGQIHGRGDAYAQACYIFRKIEKALIAAGASRSDVVRTRLYLVDVRHQEEVGRAHAEFFGAIRPAATMLAVSSLVNPEMLVEVEVDAILAGEESAHASR